MKRLLCYLIGHDAALRRTDRGAAWVRCRRCNAVTQAVTFHGRRPWEKP